MNILVTYAIEKALKIKKNSKGKPKGSSNLDANTKYFNFKNMDIS